MLRPNFPRLQVIGFTSLALEEPRHNPRITECLEESLDGATSLLGLINKVLEFSRLNGAVADKGRQALRPLRLASLVDGILDSVGSAAEVAGVEFLAVVDPALWHEARAHAHARILT
jgi:signal transduction histidine kinase